MTLLEGKKKLKIEWKTGILNAQNWFFEAEIRKYVVFALVFSYTYMYVGNENTLLARSHKD